MKRTISKLTTLLGTILLLAAWYASGSLAAVPDAPRPLLSGLLAGAVILVNAALLYLADGRILNQAGLFTPAAYIVLATANPRALWFSPFHGAALLLAVSVMFYLNYCAVRPSMMNLTGAWAALGASALLFPPFLWLVPVYAVSAVGKAEEKLKFCVASLLAVCLPLGIYAGVTSLQAGAEPAGVFFTGLWNRMTDLPRISLHFSAATLCRILLTGLLTLLAIIWSVGRLDRYKIARFAAVIRIIFLTLSICLLMLLFLPDSRHPSGLVTVLPVALLFNNYFGVPDRKKGDRTLVVILILVLIAERISCFI